MKISHAKDGFTLLELLIVMSIMGVLAVAGSAFYRNFGKNIQLSTASEAMSADMRQIRGKAMIGEGGVRWGISLVNDSADRYDLFSVTDAGVFSTSTTVSLPLGVTFSDPAEGTFKNIIFSKISGSTSATTTVLVSEGFSVTTSISSIGAIN